MATKEKIKKSLILKVYIQTEGNPTRRLAMTTEIRTAVILVGGAGLRLRPITNDLPKCMIPLHGKPLIYWTLTWLKESGFEHAVLGVSYLKEKVIQYVRENEKIFGLKVDFS